MDKNLTRGMEYTGRIVAKKKSTDSKLDRLDTFVLSGVTTVLATRGLLHLTGFPQLGNDSLHIAHVLWGGLFLSLAFLILLLGDRVNKVLIAIIGGIGFGLFIDEVGKFITQDNDYFYEPSFTIMYVLFLLIWFISRLVIVRKENEPFLSPAEWPKHKLSGTLIVLWVFAQFIIGLIVLLLTFSKGFGAINDFIGITGIGMFAGLIYAAFLGLGLYRIYFKKFPEAAHIIRGSTIFSVLGMYPFVFFNYPFWATVSMFITIPVTIGLSRLALMDLIKNLYMHNKNEQ